MSWVTLAGRRLCLCNIRMWIIFRYSERRAVLFVLSEPSMSPSCLFLLGFCLSTVVSTRSLLIRPNFFFNH